MTVTHLSNTCAFPSASSGSFTVTPLSHQLPRENSQLPEVPTPSYLPRSANATKGPDKSPLGENS